MSPRFTLPFVTMLTLAGAATAACVTDYGKGLDDPNYGAPDSLYGKTAPPKSGEGTSVSPGATPEGGTGGGAGACGGQGPISDGGDCSVKWTDLVNKMKVGQPWRCADNGCHINQPPTPRIPTGTPKEAYDALAEWKITVNGMQKPYINPCSKNPADSAFLCNVTPRAGSTTLGECGSKLMPEAMPLPPEDLALLKTWIECGSPLN